MNRLIRDRLHRSVAWYRDGNYDVGFTRATLFITRRSTFSKPHLGRRERGGEAMAVIEMDAPLTPTTLTELRAFEPVVSGREIEL
jgi:hypothetical protein